MRSLFILSLFFLSSCIKFGITDQVFTPSLPAETTNGENTMGFLYGKSIWENIRVTPGILGGLSIDTPARTTCSYYEGVLYINGSMYEENDNLNFVFESSFGFVLHNVLQSGEIFNFDSTSSSYQDYAGFYDELHGDSMVSHPNSFSVTLIRFDSTNEIASGTFSGTLYSTSNNDSTVITQGRFDFRFY
jgi:hypothetical protein